MWISKLLGFVFFLLVLVLLSIYWFYPFSGVEFKHEKNDGNFSLSSGVNGSGEFQFYENMRYPSNEISYRIHDCPLQQMNDMERALRIIEDLTILEYVSVESGEELYITCESGNVMNGDLFVAGEGGPSKIIETGDYNLILEGKILLIRVSDCPQPNVEVHELLHTLGFGHSENPNNIMYPIYECGQEIGDEIPNLINELYSIEAKPDLAFEGVSAQIKGRFLDVNFSVVNRGLIISEDSEVVVYVEGRDVKTYDLEEIEPGAGVVVKLGGIAIREINPDEVSLEIENNFGEMDKLNNKIILGLQ